MTTRSFLLLVVGCVIGAAAEWSGPPPLVLIHGVNSDYSDMDEVIQWVKEDYPDMPTFSLDAFNDAFSIVSLTEQVPKFVSLLKNVTDSYGEVNLLGYSQGGIVSRGVIEWADNPNIRNFISLSAPGVGQYGIPFLNDTYFFDHLLSKDVYKICYNELGQLISVCNYWNDPLQKSLYLDTNVYLPYLNNEIPHNNSQRFKDNFVNLNKLILVGGPDDRVIQPWQSAQYAFWDEKLNVVPYNQLPYYTQDTFGLKTLDEAGKVTFCTMSGVHHTHWPHTKSVYETCIKPYLL